MAEGGATDDLAGPSSKRYQSYTPAPTPSPAPVDSQGAKSLADAFKAKGGKVESDGDDDSEIKDAIGKEMVEAFHSKDSKRVMGAIEAAILHHMSKKED